MSDGRAIEMSEINLTERGELGNAPDAGLAENSPAVDETPIVTETPDDKDMRRLAEEMEKTTVSGHHHLWKMSHGVLVDEMYSVSRKYRQLSSYLNHSCLEEIGNDGAKLEKAIAANDEDKRKEIEPLLRKLVVEQKQLARLIKLENQSSKPFDPALDSFLEYGNRYEMEGDEEYFGERNDWTLLQTLDSRKTWPRLLLENTDSILHPVFKVLFKGTEYRINGDAFTYFPTKVGEWRGSIIYDLALIVLLIAPMSIFGLIEHLSMIVKVLLIFIFVLICYFGLLLGLPSPHVVVITVAYCAFLATIVFK